MSTLACWKIFEGSKYERIYLVADTRFSLSNGSKTVLLDSGQKVYQLRFRAKAAPFKNRVLADHDLGIGFVGNVILGQSFIGIANALLGNLRGPPNACMPSLENISIKLAQLLAKLSNGSHWAKQDVGSVEAVIVGFCPNTKQRMAYWIGLDSKRNYKAVYRQLTFIQRDDIPISNIELFGDGRAEIAEAIDTELDKVESDDDLVAAPLVGLQSVMLKKMIPTIGGEIHGGVVTPSGFCYRTFERITKRLKNGGYLYRPSFINFDAEDLPAFDNNVMGLRFIEHSLTAYTWQDS